MAKIVLNDVAGGYNLQTINDNFQKIEDELNNRVLYRDPDGEDNKLLEDLDVNGKRLFNLPEPTLASQAARLQDVQEAISGASTANLISVTPAGTLVSTNVQAALQELDGEANNIVNAQVATNAGIVSSKLSFTNGGTNVVSRTVESKLKETKSILDFLSEDLKTVVASGVYTAQNRTDMLTALTNAWNSALAAPHNLFAPSGFYEIGDANFPWRNTGAGLLDCKNITLYGEGTQSVFITNSPDGADAFQMNALQNFHIRNIKIAPILTGFAGSGSNAISITNGWDNITIRSVTIENAPGVDKGSFIDGGKALTVQPGTTTNVCGTLVADIIAKGCAEAFGMDADLVIMSGKSTSIKLDIVAENCYRAFKYSAAGASGPLTQNMTSGIDARIKSVNCQQDVVLSRVHGVSLNVQVITNKTAAARRLAPSGSSWIASDTIVESLLSTYAKNANITISGNKGECDYKARIGGTTAGSSGLNGATEFCNIYLDIGGTAATANILEINSGGNSLRTSTLEVTSVTATTLPTLFHTASLNNSLKIDGVYKGSFTGTLTGCTTSPTGSIKWTLIDNLVVLEIPTISATSNSTSASITGLPTELFPATSQSVIGITIDNGVSGISKILIGSAGTISLYKTVTLTGFTATGTKGIENSTIVYHRQ